mmetsp:Transcript_39767/g.88392  ORF Transcript_39767/g.88392 Transcript_39767/m.88392 type:complete len:376 (-) Transcript_39767:607-1734(-)|eukprot:CAMPEP_0202902832 /NCGR_PEP_ID=MMETSP1392-20130828/17071_1 /ASSEMBLY_ACC=CAM_ASM_000868 /TAXON_ID=225041 /ORGANISM="Chlamydomonas chlamydogama, Strain SAG 11-48b" /LENGTH=375 /DNA_ID=CAMNT_0049589639 /DNA_START=185 /DNA_END=1312 /DNA_ORIENTATION=-
MGSDDSTGKSKFIESKARYKVLGTMFIVGLCVGIVISERMYIRKGGSLQRPRVLTAQSITTSVTSSSKLEVSSLQAHPDTAPARNDLEKVLRQVAPSKEVFLAVANKNTMWDGMLKTFTDGIKRAGVKNHLILALDEETKKWCEDNGINAYLMSLQVHKAQQGTGDNHAVSAMKFGIIKQFIELGWAVLLSDVDIAVLQNPFEHLWRDSDVEGMTDGFDDVTAYGGIEGFDDPSMGWARYAQYFKHFNLNSGLFYLKANERTLDLMTRLDDRLSKSKYWDQSAYNEEIFILSHGKYKSPQVSVRVMEIDLFMNSKRLFKDIRKRAKALRPSLPVMVHINYHPDKHERMKAVFKYYLEDDEHALDRFPGGSEAGSR